MKLVDDVSSYTEYWTYNTKRCEGEGLVLLIFLYGYDDWKLIIIII